MMLPCAAKEQRNIASSGRFGAKILMRTTHILQKDDVFPGTNRPPRNSNALD